MINAGKLLADLKRLRKVLDADLRATHAAGAQRDAVQVEWREAFDLGRTRDTFEAFLDSAFDQAVVHWVLGCVFLRFLEDNRLVDRPFLSGPGERLDLAKERQEAHFRALPHDSDTEYLLATFGEAARLPGMAGLFDQAHNPLFRLPLSGDGAMALIRFFREVLPETGELAHDFTDPGWNTRFLGDLYQDLSEEARKRYALLQTPDFVESWILDRTLEPAIREFGHEHVTMIDPACGSGHFLLGGFGRLMREWERFAPGLPPAEQAQRSLDAIAGVDLNPFAVEIARFRLLMAALEVAGVNRLSSAPSFRISLAAGDSLLHGRHFFRRELGGAEEGFRRIIRHHYSAEDTAEIDQLLGRQYHAVVGNPPYITPKDPAMRDAYREIYDSCHMKYGLGAPFTERFFDLALAGDGRSPAGFVGLIVANSFMKREFGKKLIEEVLPRLDLTHVIDCSGAYIPGHGTPTVILFGRNRAPVANLVRAVMGIRGEPCTPADPARGAVWSSIIGQADTVGSSSDFVSVADINRGTLAHHPWSIGGGGASELKVAIEEDRQVLSSMNPEIGFASFPGTDDVFIASKATYLRLGVPADYIRPMIVGDQIRDFVVEPSDDAFVPYDRDQSLISLEQMGRGSNFLWAYRCTLQGVVSFGGRTRADMGDPWWGWYRWISDRYKSTVIIAFAEIASHNHFVLERGGKAFKQTAPIIMLPPGTGEETYLALFALLSSSVICFWLKQVSHQKQMTGGDGVRISSRSKVPYQYAGTRVEQIPLPREWETGSVRIELAALGREIEACRNVLEGATARNAIEIGLREGRSIEDFWDDMLAMQRGARTKLILLQEDLDFLVYYLYGLIDRDERFGTEVPLGVTIDAGERPFCILAQSNEDGFPVPSEVPIDWPQDLREVWLRRMEKIRQSSDLRIIEEAHYKRRWIGRQGLFNHKAGSKDLFVAAENWLLDRMESSTIWATADARLVSTNQFTDLLRRDADFLSVAALYAGRSDVNLEALVAELVGKESVPCLAALRYAEAGIRKRAQWETTWDKQRREDQIDTEVAARRDTFRAQAERRAQEQWQSVNPRRPGEQPEPYAIRMQAGAALAAEQQIDRLVAEEQRRRKRDEVGDIPVPPKFIAKDFLSSDFWRLRGGLDVPKERFVSFPHCQREADGSLVITWAGHNPLKRALAIAAYYQERKDSDGWPAERLVPLLAGVIELVPWLLQWHNEYDPDLGARMGDYFVDFVQTEARALGMTEAAVAAWTPPATPRRGRTRRAA